jgi:hypothetical protein
MKPLPPKLRAYHAVSSLNRAFAFVLLSFERLEELGMFRPKYPRAFKAMTQELQSGANFEITGMLLNREEKERAHFGAVVRKWQKLFEDPRDVLLEAKRVQRRLAKHL